MNTLSDARRRLIGRLRHRKTRAREGLVLVEGVRVVGDLLEAGVRPKFALVSPRCDALAPDLAARLGEVTEVVRVDDDTLEHCADTSTPQGVLAVAPEPDGDWFDRIGPDDRVLVLDALQDPGNVGTLVRTAAALGASGVVLLDGSVEPWNPKAVRASAGAVFRCRLAQVQSDRALERLARAGLPILVADASGSDVAPPTWHGGWALVIGSEGHGAREAIRAEAAQTVRVPMAAGVESLNAGVAGSILLYELTRHRGGPGA